MLSCKKLINGNFLDKIKKRIILQLIFIVFFDFVLFPTPILAKEIIEIEQEEFGETKIEIGLKEIARLNSLPQNSSLTVKSSRVVKLTAYSSEVSQCDSDPCRTANGFDLCQHGIEDSVAANFLPFGTKIRVPSLFGDRVFVVRDRMNARHHDKVDVWFVEKQDALKFGLKLAKIEILE